MEDPQGEPQLVFSLCAMEETSVDLPLLTLLISARSISQSAIVQGFVGRGLKSWGQVGRRVS